VKRRVFISYASSDKGVADQICATLEGAEFACWIAPRDIPPGVDYPGAILAGLHEADLLVAVISAAAVASPHILTEIGHAFSQKKPILPFRLSDTSLPPNFDYFLSTCQWFDAHDGCTAGNLDRLKQVVGDALSGRQAPPGLNNLGFRRRLALVLGVAVVLFAAGGFFYFRLPARSGAPPVASASVIPPPVSNPVQTAPAPSANRPPWVNPKDGQTYLWIPAGTFSMGCSSGDSECHPDENPAHQVSIPAGFWLGKTEVTNSAYRRIVPSADFPPSEANLPVVGISWKDAKHYCGAVGGRLPTEAEWEYAARGGTSGPYFGVLSKTAWYATNSGGNRHPVASLEPNPFGLHDMLGNASEWVLDRYYKKYDPDEAATGNVEQPLAPNASAVSRGGYWESDPAGLRVSRRVEMENDDPAPMAGVRCVAERQ
jgi:hypothetical protein